MSKTPNRSKPTATVTGSGAEEAGPRLAAGGRSEKRGIEPEKRAAAARPEPLGQNPT